MRRTRGRPKSSNGASSLHLRWVWPAAHGAEPHLVEAAATLTVLDPTPTDDLRFWALQASFDDRGRHLGAGHVGLQRHTGHPGSTAANWGGYKQGGGEFEGTESTLPSARGNPNTRDFAWEVGRPYRLSIRVDGSGWVGDTPLRTLRVGSASRLSGIVVWSEVFAPCDQVHRVRWSDLVGLTAGGVELRPMAVAVNYQAWSAGGCTNTSAALDDTGGIVQATGVRRRTKQGTILNLS